MQLFCAEVCGAGEFVSENCNYKYSYSYLPAYVLGPSVLIGEFSGRRRAAPPARHLCDRMAVPF